MRTPSYSRRREKGRREGKEGEKEKSKFHLQKSTALRSHVHTSKKWQSIEECVLGQACYDCTTMTAPSGFFCAISSLLIQSEYTTYTPSRGELSHLAEPAKSPSRYKAHVIPYLPNHTRHPLAHLHPFLLPPVPTSNISPNPSVCLEDEPHRATSHQTTPLTSLQTTPLLSLLSLPSTTILPSTAP